MGTSSPEELAPDQSPKKPRFQLEKIEAWLAALLLVLIAAGNLIPRWLPEKRSHPIAVNHSERNANLPPIDWSATPVPLTQEPHDLNTVSRIDLIELPGVGASIADSIIAYRDQNGPFRSIEDLDNVAGIGPRRVESLRNFLFVEEQGLAPALSSASSIRQAGKLSPGMIPVASTGLVNLNGAGVSEIMTIPGIGETFARRILERRLQLGRFRAWSDIAAIPGVGAKRLENIQRHATIR